MPRIITATEYTALERPTLQWLVDGLLPIPSFCVLLGEPKAGKSFWALQLAACIAQGRPFMGRPVQQGPVLYCQFDTSELVWRERLATLQGQGESIEGPLYFIHPEDTPLQVDILDPKTQALLKGAIEQAQPSLVIIDTLREIHSRKEDSATEMRVVLGALAEVVQGRALLLIHHTSKLSNKDDIRVIDLSRGSSYLAGRADALYVLIDDTLHLIPRFGDRHVLQGVRLPTGYWLFPPPASGPPSVLTAAVSQLRGRHRLPRSSHLLANGTAGHTDAESRPYLPALGPSD